MIGGKLRPSLYTSVQDTGPQVFGHDYEIDLRPKAQGVLMPGVNVSILVLERGVCDGQSMDGTEFQQQYTTQVQIRGAMPPNHAPPGIPLITHVRIEVSHQND